MKSYYCPASANGVADDLQKFLPSGVEFITAPGQVAQCCADARRGECRVFLDCPAHVDGIEWGDWRPAGLCRTVVASAWFGVSLPAGHILIQHDAWLHEVATPVVPELVAARVAGYRECCYGLPEECFPLLFRHPECAGILISATDLGMFIRRRFAPYGDWQTVIGRILGFLAGNDSVVPVSWNVPVHPAYAAAGPLPSDAEETAFRDCAAWFRQNMFAVLHGREYVLEGYSSKVDSAGEQPLSVALRCDCNGEISLVSSLSYVLDGDRELKERGDRSRKTLFRAPYILEQDSTNPMYGGAYFDTIVKSFYGDDCARAAFGVLLSGELQNEIEYVDDLLRLMCAVYRTTGRNGIRHECLRPGDFSGGRGWKDYFNEDFRTCRPHYQATTWALNLQAYVLTGFPDFLAKAKSAIRIAMAENFPDFLWTNGITQEWARMLLPLSMLVEVEDTPEHREWLDRAVNQCLSTIQPCGALREAMGKLENGRYPAPRSNEEYGTNEAALIQSNGDPACDLLYTMNYAFIGLHEAVMATGDSHYRAVADQMADFFCRIQVRSTAHPYLDGAWMRGFDYELWDYFGSSADAGWGAWCIESGWTNTWIAGTLGLRRLNRPLLCRAQAAYFRERFPAIKAEMLD